MPRYVELPDKGRVIEFPDEMPREEVERVVREQIYKIPTLRQDAPGFFQRAMRVLHPTEKGVGEAPGDAFQPDNPYEPSHPSRPDGPGFMQEMMTGASTVGRGFKDAISDVAGRVEDATDAESIGRGVDYSKRIAGQAGREMIQGMADQWRGQAARIENPPPMRDIYDYMMTPEQREEKVSMLRDAAAAMPASDPKSQGLIESGVRGVSRSAFPMLLMALGAGAGGAAMTNQILGAKYDEYRQKGYNSDRAFAGAMLSAAGQVPIEFAGTLFQFKNLMKVASEMGATPGAAKRLADFVSGVAKGAGSEGLEEALQAYPGALADAYVKRPDAPIDEYVRNIQETNKQAVEGAKIVAVGGGLMAGMGGAAGLVVDGREPGRYRGDEIGNLPDDTGIPQAGDRIGNLPDDTAMPQAGDRIGDLPDDTPYAGRIGVKNPRTAPQRIGGGTALPDEQGGSAPIPAADAGVGKEVEGGRQPTKREKALSEYQAFVESLTPEQQAKAGDLIETEPKRPASLLTKIKKTLEAPEAAPAQEAPAPTPAQETPRAPQPGARRQAAVAKKMRATAQKAKGKAQEKLNQDRQTNTARRARMAASIMDNARREIAQAETLERIADAVEAGEAGPLEKVRAKTHIETLDALLRRGQLNRYRKEGLTYGEEQARKGEPMTEADARAAKYPSGLPDEEKRLKVMGITPKNFTGAMEKYVEMKAPKAAEDPIKKAERELVGKTPGIDFFPTPKKLADRVVEMADIRPGQKVLEPSAGKGDLIDAVKADTPDAQVDAYEISGELKNLLDLKGHNVAGSDFMEAKQTPTYDRILMNPPFSKGRDVDHVRKAYDLLAPGGKLVAIMGEHPFFANDKKSVAFREWLEEVGGTSEQIKDAFKGKEAFRETGVVSRIVEIEKADTSRIETPEEALDYATTGKLPEAAPEKTGAGAAQAKRADAAAAGQEPSGDLKIDMPTNSTMMEPVPGHDVSAGGQINDIYVANQDDTVRFQVPTAEGSTVSPKEQKDALLAEIDAAKDVIDNGYWVSPMIGFDVPGDGKFEVARNRIDEFRNAVEKRFPAKSLSGAGFKKTGGSSYAAEKNAFKKLFPNPSKVTPDVFEKTINGIPSGPSQMTGLKKGELYTDDRIIYRADRRIAHIADMEGMTPIAPMESLYNYLLTDKGLPAKTRDAIRERITGKTAGVKKTKPATRGGGSSVAKAPPLSPATATGPGATQATQFTKNIKSVPGLPTDEHVEALKTVRPSAIIKDLEKRLSVPIRSRRFRQRALGIYKYFENVIRTQSETDVQTIAHEIGHRVEAVMGWPRGSTHNKEIRDLAYPGAKSKSREGFAEFIRLYITEPEMAAKKAPNFHPFFENELAKHPEMKDVFLKARANWQEYQALPDVGKVMGMIRYGADLKKWEIPTLADLYRRFFDKQEPIRQFVADVEKALGQPVPYKDSPHAWAWTYLGWSGRADQWLRFKPFRFSEKTGIEWTGESFREILKPIEEAGLVRQLDAYLIANRVMNNPKWLEKAETTLPGETFEATIDQIAEAHPEIPRAAEKLYQYNDKLIDYLVDSGRMSADSAETIRQKSLMYAPMYRVMQDNKTMALKMASGNRFANVGMPVKRTTKAALGEVYSPTESIIYNTYAMINAADRNRVGVALADLAGRVEGMGKWAEELPVKIKPLKVKRQTVEDLLEKFGNDLEITREDIEKLDIPEEIIADFIPNYRPGPGEAIFYLDGKPHIFELDPQLYKAVTDIDGKVLSDFVKLLSYPASWLRAGATLAPEFVGRNPARDIFPAFIQSKEGLRDGYKLGFDLIRGLYHVTKQTDKWQRHRAAGASRADITAMDRREMSKMRREITGNKWIKSPLGYLQIASAATEEANRVQIFGYREVNALAKEGKDPLSAILEAAVEGRDNPQDFSRIGALMQAYRALVPFSTAKIGGVDKMARAFKRDPKKVALRSFLSITIPSVLIYWAQSDDPDYQEIPLWRRAIGWNFVVRIKDYPIILTLPKPFDFGTLFGTTAEFALESWREQDPESWKAAMAKIGEIVTPGIGVQAVIPWIENWTNHLFFFDRPLIPSWKENLEPDLQKNPSTSETAQAIGSVVRAIPGGGRFSSPAQIDNLIRGYTAGLGRLATDQIDYMLRKTGITNPPEPPKKPFLVRWPLLRGFFSEGLQRNSRSIGQFWDRYSKYMGKKESQLARADAKGGLMGKSRRAEALRKAWRAQPEYQAWTKGADALRMLDDMADVVYKGEQLQDPELQALAVSIVNGSSGEPPIKTVEEITGEMKAKAMRAIYAAQINAARGVLGKKGKVGQE